MKSILNPEFRYVPAARTDIRKTFARIRKHLSEQYAEKEQYVERTAKVEPLRKKETAA